MARAWDSSRGRHTPRRRRRSMHRRRAAVFLTAVLTLVALVAGGTAAVASGGFGTGVARNLAGAWDRLSPDRWTAPRSAPARWPASR